MKNLQLIITVIILIAASLLIFVFKICITEKSIPFVLGCILGTGNGLALGLFLKKN